MLWLQLWRLYKRFGIFGTRFRNELGADFFVQSDKILSGKSLEVKGIVQKTAVKHCEKMLTAVLSAEEILLYELFYRHRNMLKSMRKVHF